MPRIMYVERTFSAGSQDLIAHANTIVAEYARQGFNLTLRQLYYQFVSRDLLANKQTEYKRLGSVINDARLAGLIDWDAIVDRTRNLQSLPHWGTPADVIGAAVRAYKNDVWADQPYRVEVWIEKDALIGVIEGVCTELDVPYFSCRGYTSQSEVWGAGQRLGKYIALGQKVVILHLGDHDPSGIDMTRDITDRLDLFLKRDWAQQFRDAHPEWPELTAAQRTTLVEKPENEMWNNLLEVRRIALTREQIDTYDPPPNPAKLTDSRSNGYLAEHGDESWELDALEPAVMAQLIRDNVDELLDTEAWDLSIQAEAQDRAGLQAAADRWPDVAGYLEGLDDKEN